MRVIVLDLADLRNMNAHDSAVFRDTVAGYRNNGFEVVLCAAEGDWGDGPSWVQEAAAQSAPFMSLCDRFVIGKPPGGSHAWTLDDKAVTPEEFTTHSFAQIRDYLGAA